MKQLRLGLIEHVLLAQNPEVGVILDGIVNLVHEFADYTHHSKKIVEKRENSILAKKNFICTEEYKTGFAKKSQPLTFDAFKSRKNRSGSTRISVVPDCMVVENFAGFKVVIGHALESFESVFGFWMFVEKM